MKPKPKATGSRRMKERGKTQVSIYLVDDAIEQLDAIAAECGRTRAFVATAFLVNALRKRKKSCAE